MNVDFSNKYDKKSKFPVKLIAVTYVLSQLEKSNVDIFDFNNVKEEKVFGKPIKFSQFCSVIENFDEYKDELHRLQAIDRRKKIELDPNNSSVYKIPLIVKLKDRIENAENKEQVFYDSLFLNYFRDYIEWCLLDVKYKQFNIREVDFTEEQKKFYFKRTFDLLDIMFDKFLSHEQSEKIINIQYSVTKNIRNSQEMIKNIVEHKNILVIDNQRFLFEKWKELNYKPTMRMMSKIVYNKLY